MHAAKIVTATPSHQPLSSLVELTGETAADPDHIANVASPVAGRIDTVSVHLGATVRRGDILATVRVPDLSKLRAEVAAKNAQSDVAHHNAERVASLYQAHAASERDAQQTAAEANSLDAQARSATEVLRALGTSSDVAVTNSLLILRAPIAGVVIAREGIVGEPVTVEHSIATIADLKRVWFLVRIYERTLARVRVGQSAEVRLNAFPDERFAGTVAYLDQQIDRTSGAFTGRIALDNTSGKLRLGLFGTARIEGEAAASQPVTLVVPKEALAQLGERTVVFVQVGEGEYEARDVVVVQEIGGLVALSSGLVDGESVVVSGAFTLKSVAVRSTLDEDN